jgi:hypothetical protein
LRWDPFGTFDGNIEAKTAQFATVFKIQEHPRKFIRAQYLTFDIFLK